MNPLRDLQDQVAARLTSTNYLADVPLFTEVLGDMTTTVARAIAAAGMSENPNGKSGVSILVLTPFGRGTGEAAKGVVGIEVTVRITVWENPLVNASGDGIRKPGLDVLWQCVSLLHGWRPGLGAKAASLQRFDSDEDDEGRIGYSADFNVPRVFDIIPFS